MSSKGLIILLSLAIASNFSYGQIGGKLGNLKNKAEEKVNNVGTGKNKADKNESEGSSKVESKVTDSGLSCYELEDKANELYAKEEYEEAWKYYSEAEADGCITGMDGMSRVNMNNCKKIVNTTPEEAAAQQAQIDGIMGQMEAQKYSCDNIEKDNGISSPVHTKNIKKIVFSKTEIVKGQENESSFTNSFSATDNIYPRVYLEKSIGTEAKSIGDCYGGSNFIRWTFDDGATKLPEWLDESNFTATDEDLWTTFQPGMSPSESDMNYDESKIKNFVKIVRYLPVGTHKVKMEVVYDIPEDEQPAGSRDEQNSRKFTTKFGTEKVLATGEFTLNVTEAGKKALYKKACPLYKDEVADYNRSAFTLVSNATSLVKETKNIDWNKFTLLKIVGAKDWKYEKNYYGVILSRSAGAGVYLLNKEDGFIYYSSVSFYQENTSSGGSSYSSVSATVEAQNIEYTRNYDSFCKECIGK